MARRSKVARLPKKVREAVDRLIRNVATIDEIVAHLDALGAEVSRSAVGRYKQKTEAKFKRYVEAQEVAGVWVPKLGVDPRSDVGRLLAEMLKTVAFQHLAQLSDEEAEAANPRDLHFLGRMIKDLESAGKISADREIKIREKVLNAVVEKLDEASNEAEAAGEPGLSAERIAQLRRDFLGVREGAAP